MKWYQINNKLNKQLQSCCYNAIMDSVISPINKKKTFLITMAMVNYYFISVICYDKKNQGLYF